MYDTYLLCIIFVDTYVFILSINIYIYTHTDVVISLRTLLFAFPFETNCTQTWCPCSAGAHEWQQALAVFDHLGASKADAVAFSACAPSSLEMNLPRVSLTVLQGKEDNMGRCMDSSMLRYHIVFPGIDFRDQSLSIAWCRRLLVQKGIIQVLRHAAVGSSGRLVWV